MAVVKWKPGIFGWHRDPFSEMDRLRREMDRIFGVYTGGREMAPAAGVFPALNMSEDDHNLYVRAELPGVAPENIEITTKENNLILKDCCGGKESILPSQGARRGEFQAHHLPAHSGGFRQSHSSMQKWSAYCNLTQSCGSETPSDCGKVRISQP